ncbi:cation:proton antiporter [Poseidonibacter ostreae]|jgi:Kef-type K+ transport system membrane component KefB|uniref:Cation:proton antiporter n=1 Tax=Poseidonibacter ostreae TaxID=2654171 RepID=A0A6L4WRN0_9BACT|nr:cation:proton antiporter [Poseidonibacter ostreae]KAB7886699.1 cation:proton antiporter [Poseidonibacter ostreae]KAB7888169.1 cation:proton antiporter [Poseidonibacter ostreae]KAB7892055.1 cation:proton antiporter [Poseidonibacter ostreae]MAC84949.1 sodium:proton antiporter [Arcobacter sp.]|tara:strand:- start:1901 stop:3061 length:1161 start_codon:yes stop_codon:yes gene_type:complete
MTEEISIIITVSLIIFISPLISKILRLPTITVEIMLGALAVYFAFIVEHAILHLVAELGFLYLMFLAGLEVDLKKLVNISPSLLKKSLLFNLILFSLSGLITWYFGLSNLFIVILPLISIGILAALKKEYGDVDWIRLAIVVGLIGEIVSIFALTTVSALLEFGINFEFYKTMILFTGFLVSMLFIYKLFHNLIWWYPGIKAYLMPEKDHQEQDIRMSMAIFFLMITVMMYLHLEVAFGAFIAGTFITTFFEEHNKQLPHKLEHFGFGWLVPIFFISVGASFEIEAIFQEGLVAKALLITLAMVIIRLVASTLFIKDIGLNKFYMLGLSLSMPLTLLIAVTTIAYNNHSITQEYYYAFILAAILEVLLVMIAIRILSYLSSLKTQS